MAQTVTLSSSGNSATIDLNPVAKETIFQVTVSAGSSGLTYIQCSLDEPNVNTSALTWANLSSAIASSAADGGLGSLLTILSPVSAVRLAGAQSSAGGTYNTTATLKVLQSVTG